MQKYRITGLPNPFILLIYCSCAWWGAETTIEIRAGSRMQSSILNMFESELQLGGHPIHSKNDKQGVIVTEWLGPYANQRHKDIPDKAYRYKLRFQFQKQSQQIVVSVRYQEFLRGTATTTIGWGRYSGPSSYRSGWSAVTYESGNLNPVFWGDEPGSGWGEFSSYSGGEDYDFDYALWSDCQPDWIIDPIEDLLYSVIRRIGADSELSWVLVRRPEFSGPKYLGPLPRK